MVSRVRFTAPMGTSLLGRLRRSRVMITAALCAAVVAAGIGVALVTRSPAWDARYHQARLGVGGDVYRYLVYVPASDRPASTVPLLVVLHGCRTTATQRASSSNRAAVATGGSSPPRRAP
jgi:poly(3-hydroxybutyrate) depolymerase